MAKATAQINRTANVRLNLTTPLTEKAFKKQFHRALEAIPGVNAAWLGENGHQVGLDLVSSFTGANKARGVVTAAAKILGVTVEGEVQVVGS